MRLLNVLFAVLILFASCSDRVSIQEDDLQKYDWLQPFLLQNPYTFQSGYHNTDNGPLSFRYMDNSKDPKMKLLYNIDTVAKLNMWLLVDSSFSSRKYSKEIKLYPSFSGEVSIEIKKNKENIDYYVSW